MHDETILWYKNPTSNWKEGIPLGNGKMGAMVFGTPSREVISLNEDTLWSGMPFKIDERLSKEHYDSLNLAERLVSLGKYRKAQDIIEDRMLGPWSSSYQPLGNLIICDHGTAITDETKSQYERSLNMGTGIAKTQYMRKGHMIRQEMFISGVDNALVIKMETANPAGMKVSVSLDSVLNHSISQVNENSIRMLGQAPVLVEPLHQSSVFPIQYDKEKGIKFAAVLTVISNSGEIENQGANIMIKGSQSLEIIVSTETSFNGFQNDPVKCGKNYQAICENRIYKMAAESIEKIKERHVCAYSSFYNRVKFELENDDNKNIFSTDERLNKIKRGESDKGLIVQFFNFSRYLMIASSSPGSQPANLQGIWNDKPRPPWTSNYTININTEMNYWIAEVLNLSEFHNPLFKMIQEMEITGTQVAKKLYHCQGWVSHQGVDIWRQVTPQGKRSHGPASWAYWPMGGVWLLQHIWNHYEFTLDIQFLEKHFYLIKGSVLFFLDYMKQDSDGFLNTMLSTSPENSFLISNEKAAVSKSSTMDIELLYDLFTIYLKSLTILRKDDEYRASVEVAITQLRPLKIGKFGQLKEWYKDFEEAEPGHRHIAHAYGLYPSSLLTPERNIPLSKAIEKTIYRRRQHEGDDTIGWCYAWYVNLFARLKQGNLAEEYLIKLMKNLFNNLFNAHRHPSLDEEDFPLTIEANFGAAAGIAELLLQSHEGCIQLLPCLPDSWESGSISGLKARGNIEVSIEWKCKKLLNAKLISKFKQAIKIKSDKDLVINEEQYIPSNGYIYLSMEARKFYKIKA